MNDTFISMYTVVGEISLPPQRCLI